MTPSRTAMIVGIDRMSKCTARSCSASVSTLPNTMSGCRSETRSYTGANARHGPHHAAQKSTSTIPSAPVTSSKVAPVSVLVAMTSPIVSYVTNRSTRGMELTFPQLVGDGSRVSGATAAECVQGR